MNDNRHNPVLIPDPLDRPPVRRADQEIRIVPGPSINLDRLVQILDGLIDAKLEDRRAGGVSEDFASGYVAGVGDARSFILWLATPSSE